MRRTIGLAAVTLTLALGQGIATAPRAASAAEQTAETIAGLVTKIDLDRSRVTVRSSDGMTHEFEASAETLKDLKVGDRIEVQRRPATN